MGDLGPRKAAELAVLVEKEVEQVGDLVVAVHLHKKIETHKKTWLRITKESSGQLLLRKMF